MPAHDRAALYQEHELQITKDVLPALTMLVLRGTLDYTTHARFQRHADDVFREQPPPALIIDLSELEFCDSSSLSALIAIRRKFPDPDASLVLVGVNGRMARLLELTGVIALFRCFATRDDAQRNLGL
ncbi:STAS domain-containing protein [Microbispora hainanensis]|uniref:STAS domain-containing protein n=1 Tax=Microbispora hainanensis TaxID=568844 RepID=UPI0033D024B3